MDIDLTQKSYQAINGLKFLLMLLVMSCHYYNTLAYFEESVPHFPGYYFVFIQSHLAVEVFFFISGFLMTKSMMNREEAYSAFLYRRVKRLFPLEFISTVIILLIVVVDNVTINNIFGLEINVWKIFLSLTGTTRLLYADMHILNGPMWYVQVLFICEQLMYLYRHKLQHPLICLFIITCSLSLKMLSLDIPLFNKYIMRGLFNYFLGVFTFEMIRKRINWKAIASFMLVCACPILIIVIVDRSTYYVGDYQLLISLVVSPALMLGCIFLPPVIKLFSIPPLNYLGKTTYSLLATHMPLIYVLRILRHIGMPIDTRNVSFYLSYLLTAIVIGILSYEILEKRLLPRCVSRLEKILYTIP